MERLQGLQGTVRAMRASVLALIFCSSALLGGISVAAPIDVNAVVDNRDATLTLTIEYQGTVADAVAHSATKGADSPGSQRSPVTLTPSHPYLYAYFLNKELSPAYDRGADSNTKSLLAGFFDSRVLRVSEPSAIALIALGLLVLVARKALKNRRFF